jgi:hypothetical protein
MILDDIERQLATILDESKAWIPAEQLADMCDLVSAGESGVAFENFCTQLLEYDAVIPLAPWGDDGRTPLFEYCPCCGVEWGYPDATPTGARRFREQWLQRGGEWDRPDQRPQDWDRAMQMAAIPHEYK